MRIGEASGSTFPLTLLDVSEGDGGLAERASACLPVDAPGDGDLSPQAMRALMLEEPRSAARLAETGDHLFGLLAQGAVGDALRDLNGARIYLDIRPRHLRRLPWELLRRDKLPVFALEDSAWARIGPQTDLHAAAAPERWPLRILVVDGSRPDDPVGADEELEELQVALRPIAGLVDMEVLRRPTVTTVERTYAQRRPHVFHFIGHGGAADDGGGALRLRDEDSEHDEDADWPGDAIREQLRTWQPRVAIINACRTANYDDHEGVWDVSDAFVDLGVPAVIGMQGNIPVTAATRFTAALYAALARGKALDLALRAARLSLREGKGRQLRDFGLPVLQLSRRAEAVLPLGHAVAEDVRKTLERTRWSDLHAFVDRAPERRRVWRLAEPRREATLDGNAAARLDLLLIHGESGAGKSALVRSCLRTLELAGGNVAYVEFGARTVNFLDVLRALRDELTASAVHGAHNAEAFRPFNHTVNHLLDGHTPPAPPDGPVEDRGVPLPQREAGPPDTVERLFAAFRGALQAAATADEPLLIALDGLSHVEVTDRARLGVELLEPVAVGRIPGVRMVVVASEADVPEALRGRDNALRLGAFEHDDFCALVRLSLRQVGYRNDPDLGDAIARWVKKVKAPTGKMLAAFHVLGDASGLEREDE